MSQRKARAVALIPYSVQSQPRMPMRRSSKRPSATDQWQPLKPRQEQTVGSGDPELETALRISSLIRPALRLVLGRLSLPTSRFLPSDSLFLLGPYHFEMLVHPSPIDLRFHRFAECSSFRRAYSMNLMLALSLFNTLAIGMIPAYLISKLEQTDLQK